MYRKGADIFKVSVAFTGKNDDASIVIDHMSRDIDGLFSEEVFRIICHHCQGTTYNKLTNAQRLWLAAKLAIFMEIPNTCQGAQTKASFLFNLSFEGALLKCAHRERCGIMNGIISEYLEWAFCTGRHVSMSIETRKDWDCLIKSTKETTKELLTSYQGSTVFLITELAALLSGFSKMAVKLYVGIGTSFVASKNEEVLLACIDMGIHASSNSRDDIHKLGSTRRSSANLDANIYPIYGKCLPEELQPYTATISKEISADVKQARPQFYSNAARQAVGVSGLGDCSVANIAGYHALAVIAGCHGLWRPFTTLDNMVLFREAWRENSRLLHKNGNLPRYEAAFELEPSTWQMGLEEALQETIAQGNVDMRAFSTRTISVVDLYVDTLVARAHWSLEALRLIADGCNSFRCTVHELTRVVEEVGKICQSFYSGRSRWTRSELQRPVLSALPWRKCGLLESLIFSSATSVTSWLESGRNNSDRLQLLITDYLPDWSAEEVLPMVEPIPVASVCDCCMGVCLSNPHCFSDV